jgi:hypothetical protein
MNDSSSRIGTALHVATRRAIALFVAGLGLLVAMTLFEHTALLRAILEHPGAAGAYLGLQAALFLASLAYSVKSLLRGAARDRWIVIVPALLVLFYFSLLISGPG